MGQNGICTCFYKLQTQKPLNNFSKYVKVGLVDSNRLSFRLFHLVETTIAFKVVTTTHLVVTTMAGM